jgi:hypothetical protein
MRNRPARRRCGCSGSNSPTYVPEDNPARFIELPTPRRPQVRCGPTTGSTPGSAAPRAWKSVLPGCSADAAWTSLRLIEVAAQVGEAGLQDGEIRAA